MNSQLIITCGAFAGILALAFNFYTKQETINIKIKIAFIVLLLIDIAVFGYAVSSTAGVNSPPMVISLMSDKANPQEAGTTIKWTAAALDPENDLVQYKFFLDGQQRTDWSYDSTWYWNTSSVDIGSHTIGIKVKDGNHDANGDDSKPIDFIISPRPNRSPAPAMDDTPPVATPNLPPLISALDSAPSSPQAAGTTITWTTDASDPDNDKIYYQYLLNGNPVTGWERHNEWPWQTSEENIGNNIIEVLVRDKNHAGQSGSDDRKSASFTISPQSNPKPLYETQTSSNQPQQDQPSQSSSNGPIRLSSIGAYHNTFPGLKYDSAADMKIGGKAYEYGVQFTECAFLAPSQYYVAYFNLNNDYSRLTGLIGLDDKTDTGGEATVYFGKEENLLIDTLKINPGDLPTNVDIDLIGVNRLIISAPPISSCTRYIDLIDMKLEKNIPLSGLVANVTVN
jgi:hypothetical protein